MNEKQNNPEIVKTIKILNVIKSGSTVPVHLETSKGEMIAKWTRTAQGPINNISDWIGLNLAREFGLDSPKTYILEVGKEAAASVRETEIREMIEKSEGLNLGIEYLERYAQCDSEQLDRIPKEQKELCFLFDVLFLNFDRSLSNTNIIGNGSAYSWVDFASLMEIICLVTKQAEPPMSVWERLRYHPFYQLELHSSSFKKIESSTIRKILYQIPNEWLGIYDLDVEFLKNELFARIVFLVGNSETVFRERIKKIQKIEYKTKEEIKEEQGRKRREFEKKFGKF
ncbi:hypothetical protein A0128_08360 [Leptospira tipperaryensis]|uniref:HipA-like kinase domain-containing protein n=1 Tax=Leptospira tipperaryensis TaxID=2564040 RepID=A0A1D7UW85_9LEPT|nr:HipA family kinase [Leptospira tipperaryensis]AOP33852.1 hypothetical protein A0128_08360 [Leptospira tipperaryensis]